MLKILAVVIVLGVTNVLASLDEEHTFSAGFLAARLRRGNLPVTFGNAAFPLDDLEELVGNALVREERRSGRNHRKNRRKGWKSHQRHGHGPNKYEDDSNEDEPAIPWYPSVLSDEFIDPPSTIDIPKAWEELDQDGQEQETINVPISVDQSQYSRPDNSGVPETLPQIPTQYPPPATSDFFDSDPDGC